MDMIHTIFVGTIQIMGKICAQIVLIIYGIAGIAQLVEQLIRNQ